MKSAVLLLAAVIVFASCKKEIRTLPDPTQTGANTFGAKVNGENWGPLKAGIMPTLPVLEARFWTDSSFFLNIRNFSRTPTETEMEIFVDNITGPGVYLLNQPTRVFPYHTASYAYFVKRKFTIQDEWVTSNNATGQVEITKFDKQQKIISGTFQFTANATYDSGPLTVTEGRFDVTTSN
jgi:hypothetical protein